MHLIYLRSLIWLTYFVLPSLFSLTALFGLLLPIDLPVSCRPPTLDASGFGLQGVEIPEAQGVLQCLVILTSEPQHCRHALIDPNSRPPPPAPPPYPQMSRTSLTGHWESICISSGPDSVFGNLLATGLTIDRRVGCLAHYRVNFNRAL